VLTTDSAGNLGSAPFSALAASSGSGTIDPNALNASLGHLDHRVNKTFTGVAMSFAMAGVPTVLPNEKFVLTTNWGTSRARTARH